MEQTSFRAGLRIGLPVVLPTFAIGLSFGVLARPVLGSVVSVLMSVLVFGGGAQFAALSVLQGGGTAVAAVIAGSLMNTRFVAMSLALAPSLRGPRWQRFAESQAVVDASFVLANRRDGTFDLSILFGTSLMQYLAWGLGTVVGVALGGGALEPRRIRNRRDLPGVLPGAAGRGARGPRPPGGGGAGGRRHAGVHDVRAARGSADRRRADIPVGAASPVIATATSVGVLVALIITTLLLKGTGPMALGGRRPPERAMSVVSLVAPAIVSALVVYETFSRTSSGVTVDERVIGQLAACGAIVAKLPMTAVILIAAATTALARLVL